VSWLGAPLSQDQSDVIALVDALVAKRGDAPGDENPADVAKAREALAGAGLWTLGVSEELGGGGAPLQLRLTAMAALGRHWAALAWASAQVHAAVETLAENPASAGLLERIYQGDATVCVVDVGSTRVDLVDVGDRRIRGDLSRLDPAGETPYVIVLAGDSAAWVLPADALRATTPLRRTGMAGALTIAADVDGVAHRVTTSSPVAEVRARMQLAGAAIAAGIAVEAAERSLEYSHSRIQFGAPLTALPTVRQSLFDQAGMASESLALALGSDMMSPVRAASALTHNCARAIAVAAAAVQSHGGYGYLAEYDVERLLRDAISLRAATDSANGARVAAGGLTGRVTHDTDIRSVRS
jgi:alkylation response protein AidB-like acyl-CoA dehydrogenase